MKRIAFLLAALLTLSAAVYGCEGVLPAKGTPAPVDPDAVVIPALTPEGGGGLPTDAPPLTEGFAAYENRREVIYYPEGSDEATAEYKLDATLPFFTAGDEAAASMNEAVALYRAELLERVVSERLPLADRADGEDAPSTLVNCEMEFAQDYLNAGFYEEANYGDSAEHALFTLVFDRAGEEQSLASVTGLFDPSDLAAQQVLNLIAKDESVYYGDITPENVRLALDLFNAFGVNETGYVLYAAEGTLARPELGIVSFSVEKAAFYPEFVGDVIPAQSYEALQIAANLMARACAPDYLSFSEGSPSGLCASGFLSGLLARRGVQALPEAEYNALFAAYFTGARPTDLIENGDGTTLENGTYTIPGAPLATYDVELVDARLENGLVTLSGSLIYGVPGASDASRIANVEISLKPDAAAETGYQFEAFSIY